MGMFDKPQYLTSNKSYEGYVQTGEKFWLHRARIEGTTTINGKVLDQAKMLVSHDRDGKQEVVFTSGMGITSQVKRMDADDMAAMPMELRIDEVPSKSGNATKIMTPADQLPPEAAADDDIPF